MSRNLCSAAGTRADKHIQRPLEAILLGASLQAVSDICVVDPVKSKVRADATWPNPELPVSLLLENEFRSQAILHAA